MSTSLLYHRFGVVGYRYVRQTFEAGLTFFRIEQPRERLHCPECGSDNVWAQGGIERSFRGLPIGNQPTFLELKVPRVYCFGCGETYVTSGNKWRVERRRSCQSCAQKGNQNRRKRRA